MNAIIKQIDSDSSHTIFLDSKNNIWQMCMFRYGRRYYDTSNRRDILFSCFDYFNKNGITIVSIECCWNNYNVAIDDKNNVYYWPLVVTKIEQEKDDNSKLKSKSKPKKKKQVKIPYDSMWNGWQTQIENVNEYYIDPNIKPKKLSIHRISGKPFEKSHDDAKTESKTENVDADEDDHSDFFEYFLKTGNIASVLPSKYLLVLIMDDLVHVHGVATMTIAKWI